MIALAFDGDLFAQVAAADLPQDAVALADRQQDGVEHLVDALDDLTKDPLETIGLAAPF